MNAAPNSIQRSVARSAEQKKFDKRLALCPKSSVATWGRKVDSVQVFSYIYSNHRSFMRKRIGLSNQRLLEVVLFPKDAAHSNGLRSREKIIGLSPGTISEAFQGKSRPDWLNWALSQDSVKREISKQLGISNLFELGSLQELTSAIVRAEMQSLSIEASRSVGDLPSTWRSVEVFECRKEPAIKGALFGSERHCRDLLVERLTSSSTPFVRWPIPPWAGASLVLASAAVSQAIRDRYNFIILVRPSSLIQPYRAEVEQIFLALGLPAPVPGTESKTLIELLDRKKVLLCLSSAEYVQEVKYGKESYIHGLLRRICHTHEKGRSPRVLLMGDSVELSRYSTELLGGDEAAATSLQLNKYLKVQSDRRFDDFKKHWTAYRRLRGFDRIEDGGSRLKRARWHYENLVKTDVDVWPASIRFRAFMLSDLSNHSAFDPTQGLNSFEIPGIGLPRDIEILRDDFSSYLQYLKQTTRNKNGVRALRICSVAKHWMTEDLVKLLGKNYVGDDFKVSALSFEAFHGSLNANRSDQQCVTLPGNSGNRAPGYTLSMGLRAIIQDDWLLEEGTQRAVAHWRIARHFFDNQNDKQLLEREFPYEPHWGRSRMLILSECIRHLVRSCSDSACSVQTDSEASSQPFGFPDPPRRQLAGTTPYQIYNFCFEQLYQREINGSGDPDGLLSTVDGTIGRSLSKRHGAFELAVELLQLLGEGQKIGHPHPCLSKENKFQYLRESGLALLDLGELQLAQECFERLRAAATGLREEVDALLLLALVKSERMDSASAIDHIEDVIGQVRREGVLSHRDREAFFARVRARLAHMAYLTGNYVNVVRHAERLIQRSKPRKRAKPFSRSSEKKAKLEPNLELAYIAALSHISPKGDEALTRCFDSLFWATGEGHQHDSLSFRISLGRLLRREGRLAPAEEVLDGVQRDILRYGCAERTYLSLLLEAGKVLLAQDRFLRAHASYLRPCALRSAGRGFERFTQLACRTSIICLTELEEQVSHDVWPASLELIVQEEQRHVSRDQPKADGLISTDPLFGYHSESSVNVIRTFKDLKSVQKEILVMKSLLA